MSCATKLIISKIRESGNAIHDLPADRPTDPGVHVFYTNAQTNTPYLACLPRGQFIRMKACSSIPVLVLYTLKPHGWRRPVMSKSVALVRGDFEGENNASLGIDRGSMLISN